MPFEKTISGNTSGVSRDGSGGMVYPQGRYPVDDDFSLSVRHGQDAAVGNPWSGEKPSPIHVGSGAAAAQSHRVSGRETQNDWQRSPSLPSTVALGGVLDSHATLRQRVNDRLLSAIFSAPASSEIPIPHGLGLVDNVTDSKYAQLMSERQVGYGENVHVDPSSFGIRTTDVLDAFYAKLAAALPRESGAAMRPPTIPVKGGCSIEPPKSAPPQTTSPAQNPESLSLSTHGVAGGNAPLLAKHSVQVPAAETGGVEAIPKSTPPSPQKGWLASVNIGVFPPGTLPPRETSDLKRVHLRLREAAQSHQVVGKSGVDDLSGLMTTVQSAQSSVPIKNLAVGCSPGQARRSANLALVSPANVSQRLDLSESGVENRQEGESGQNEAIALFAKASSSSQLVPSVHAEKKPVAGVLKATAKKAFADIEKGLDQTATPDFTRGSEKASIGVGEGGVTTQKAARPGSVATEQIIEAGQPTKPNVAINLEAGNAHTTNGVPVKDAQAQPVLTKSPVGRPELVPPRKPEETPTLVKITSLTKTPRSGNWVVVPRAEIKAVPSKNSAKPINLDLPRKLAEPPAPVKMASPTKAPSSQKLMAVPQPEVKTSLPKNSEKSTNLDPPRKSAELLAPGKKVSSTKTPSPENLVGVPRPEVKAAPPKGLEQSANLDLPRKTATASTPEKPASPAKVLPPGNAELSPEVKSASRDLDMPTNLHLAGDRPAKLAAVIKPEDGVTQGHGHGVGSPQAGKSLPPSHMSAKSMPTPAPVGRSGLVPEGKPENHAALVKTGGLQHSASSASASVKPRSDAHAATSGNSKKASNPDPTVNSEGNLDNSQNAAIKSHQVAKNLPPKEAGTALAPEKRLVVLSASEAQRPQESAKAAEKIGEKPKVIPCADASEGLCAHKNRASPKGTEKKVALGKAEDPAKPTSSERPCLNVPGPMRQGPATITAPHAPVGIAQGIAPKNSSRELGGKEHPVALVESRVVTETVLTEGVAVVVPSQESPMEPGFDLPKVGARESMVAATSIKTESVAKIIELESPTVVTWPDGGAGSAAEIPFVRPESNWTASPEPVPTPQALIEKNLEREDQSVESGYAVTDFGLYLHAALRVLRDVSGSAINVYSKFFSVDGSLRFEYYRGRAIHNVNMGDYRRAVGFFEKALAQRPHDKELGGRLGLCYLKTNRHQLGMRMLEEALVADMGFPGMSAALGSAYALHGEHQKAVDWLQKALVDFPEDYDIHFRLGVALDRLGNHQKAAEVFEAAIKIRPEEVKAYRCLASSLEQAERHAEAVHYFKKANELEGKLG